MASSTDNEKISSLYGSASDTSSEPPTLTPVTESAGYSTPDKLRNPYVLDKESVEARLYADEIRTTLPSESEGALALLEPNEARRGALRQIFEYFLGETGMTGDQGHGLLTALAEVNSGTRVNSSTDPLTELSQEYGVVEAMSKLDKAKELVETLPDLAPLLNGSGLGNDIKIIRLFIQLAEGARGKYRIKQFKRSTRK